VDVLAELAKALDAGTASFWQQGELSSQARVEVMLAGSQRLVFDVTAFKGGGFAVDAQFNNDRAMEAVGGPVSYNLAVRMDGHQVMNESVTQAQYQNVQRSFASNNRDGGQGLGDASQGWLNIRQDIDHLQATGAVANYDLTMQVDPGVLAGYGSAIAGASWGDVLSNNGVTQYMPMTGGRADIGPTTQSNAAWLISQDVRAAEFALGQAQAAGAVPWNMWNAQAGTWLNDNAYPDLWLDGRGGTGRPGDSTSWGLTQQVPGSTGWTPDTAHQPDLSYVSYVLTGQRWILDNLQAQAAWNVLITWPGYGKRGETNDIVVQGEQVRSEAWALRQLQEAAWISPDGSLGKAYFQQAANNNWAFLVSKIPEWTAQQGEGHGWVPGLSYEGGIISPWQQDYFASTTIAAARQGNADALTFLKWQENFLVGRFLHEADGFNPRDGAAYQIIAEGFTTWRAMGEQTVATGRSNGTGWANSQGDYGQLALATLAAIHDLTGSAQAKLAFDKLLALNPPFTDPASMGRATALALTKPDLSNTPFTIQEIKAAFAASSPIPGLPAVGLTDPNLLLAGKVGSLAEGLQAFLLVPAPDTRDTGPASQPIAFDPNMSAASPRQTAAPLDPNTGGTSLASLSGPGHARADGGSAPMASAEDRLVLRISEDAFKGHAMFVVIVDGVQQSGLMAARASHARGESDPFEFTGNFGPGPHALTVRYLNDYSEGGGAGDRNLYINRIEYNGVDTHQSQALLVNGDALFQF
jgi:hypothetical protein